MASVKIKFRPSSGDGDLGTIYYRVIHNRVVRQMATSFKIYKHEWNNSKSIVILQRDNQQRREYLREIQLNINEDIHRLRLIINLFEKNGVSYTADDVLFSFKKSENLLSVFMNSLIKTLEQIGKSMGFSKERIRQIENNALQKLRKVQNIDSLKSYLEVS